MPGDTARGIYSAWRLLALWVATLYVSAEAHELAHWAAALATGVHVVFGLNGWRILSQGCAAAALAAGPLATLALALLGLTPRIREKHPLTGYALATSNSLLGVGTALGAAWYALTHPDPCTSEPIWKLYLLPLYTAALLASLRAYPGLARPSLILALLGVTAAEAAAIVAADQLLVWPCITAGNPLCTPIAGYPPLLAAINTAALAALVYLAVRLDAPPTTPSRE